MDIKIGDYVRTTDGIIEKVIRIGKTRYIHEECYQTDKKEALYTEDIKTHSENLIDLIEAGDIVNGNFVYFNEDFKKLGYDFIDGDNEIYFESIYTYANLPREILTKEQYERSCYNVEE